MQKIKVGVIGDLPKNCCFKRNFILGAIVMDIAKKRQREKAVVGLMIDLYCHGNHHTKGKICADCQALKDYACERSDRCPFMENKTFCSNCRVHCYSPQMREDIKKVMRYAGPRMIYHHPLMAIRHLLESKKEQRLTKKEN